VYMYVPFSHLPINTYLLSFCNRCPDRCEVTASSSWFRFVLPWSWAMLTAFLYMAVCMSLGKYHFSKHHLKGHCRAFRIQCVLWTTKEGNTLLFVAVKSGLGARWVLWGYMWGALLGLTPSCSSISAAVLQLLCLPT
jgi:hypothetical protein